MRLLTTPRARPATHRPTRPGFTLIELLVTIGIMIFVLSISVVAFQAMFRNVGVNGASRVLRAAVDGARIRAVQQHRLIRFEIQLVPDTTTHQWRVAANAGDGAPDWKLLPEFVAIDTNAGSGGSDGLSGSFRPTSSDRMSFADDDVHYDTVTRLWFTAVHRISVTFGPQGRVRRWALSQRFLDKDNEPFYHEWQGYRNPTSPFCIRLTNMRDSAVRMERKLRFIPLTGGIEPYDAEGQPL
jgi:Tfp pilus assembly protein FimT